MRILSNSSQESPVQIAEIAHPQQSHIPIDLFD